MIHGMLKMIIRRYWKIILGMVLICALGSAAMTGLSSSYQSLQSTLGEYLHTYGLAEATITLEKTAGQEGLAAKLQSLPGIESAEPRCTYNTVLAEKNGCYSRIRMLYYSQGDRLRFYYRERAAQSQTSDDSNPVLVDFNFARAHHIRPGDSLSLRSMKDKTRYRDYFVAGLVSTPETLAVTAFDGLKAATPDLGYVYASREVLEEEVEPEYKDRLAALNTKEKDLKEAKQTARSNYREATASLDTAEQELAQAQARFDRELPKWKKKLARLEKTKKKLRKRQSQAKKYQKKLDKQQKKLEEQEAEIHALIHYGLSLLNETDRVDSHRADAVIRQGSVLMGSQKEELEKALKQLSDGQKKLQKEERKLRKARKKLRKGRRKVDKGITQIRTGIAEAEKQLREGAARIERERAETEKAWKLAKTRFRKGEKDLKSAREELVSWKEYESWCNQFLLYFRPGTSPEETLQTANSTLRHADAPEIRSSVLYEDSAVKTDIDANIIPLQKMTVFVPLLLFGLSLMMVFLFLTLMILQMRREIGIWRALGAHQRQIRGALCLMGLLISLGAALPGGVLAYQLARFMDRYFEDYFQLPFYHHQFLWSRFLLACVLAGVVCQAAILLASATLGRIQPAESMSRSIPATVRISPLLRKLTADLPPLAKFCVLSLLRSRGRFLFSSVCLASSVVLIFTSLSFIASRDVIMEETFGQRIHYDCQIFFTRKPTPEVLSQLRVQEGVSEVQPASYYSTDVRFQGKATHVTLYAMTKTSALVDERDRDGHPLSIPRSGLLLEVHTARNLGAVDGDSVHIGKASLPLAGLPHQCIERIQYVSNEQAKVLGEPAAWMLLCKVTKKGEKALSSYLAQQDDAEAVVFTRAVNTRIDQVFRSLDLYIWILVVFSALLGMVIIITTSQHNLLEVKVQLCTLRSLGFQHGQVSRFWFIQSLLYYLVACLIGILTGTPVAALALHLMEDPQKEYPLSSALWPWLLTFGTVLLYVVLSHMWAMRLLRRWNIAEVTRERE